MSRKRRRHARKSHAPGQISLDTALDTALDKPVAEAATSPLEAGEHDEIQGSALALASQDDAHVEPEEALLTTRHERDERDERDEREDGPLSEELPESARDVGRASDDEAEHFAAEAEAHEERPHHESHSLAPYATDLEPDLEPEVDADLASLAPETARTTLRRARFTRYVRAAVVAGAAICVFAAVRVKLGRSTQRDHLSFAQAAAAAPPAPAIPEPQDETSPEDGVSAEDLLVTEAARTERREAQRALEKHELTRAIESAQRAVAADPTEAEGWLLLGAAHLERGDAVSARKAFQSCVAQAKAGARGECVWFSR